jgi:hypothetical protein
LQSSIFKFFGLKRGGVPVSRCCQFYDPGCHVEPRVSSACPYIGCFDRDKGELLVFRYASPDKWSTIQTVIYSFSSRNKHSLTFLNSGLFTSGRRISSSAQGQGS